MGYMPALLTSTEGWDFIAGNVKTEPKQPALPQGEGLQSCYYISAERTEKRQKSFSYKTRSRKSLMTDRKLRNMS